MKQRKRGGMGRKHVDFYINFLPFCIFYTHTHTHKYIYNYIERQRERERERKRERESETKLMQRHTSLATN